MDSVPDLYRRALWGSMDRLGGDEMHASLQTSSAQADTLLGLLEAFELSAQHDKAPMPPSTPDTDGVVSDYRPAYYN